MNEISSCCRLLGVKHGASLEEVKKAYRDLVQVWHPDRFAGNERLQVKAQEQLKEINLAYEHLMACAFRDGVLFDPGENESTMVPAAETSATTASPDPDYAWTDEPDETPAERKPRNGLRAFLFAAVILVVGGIFLWYPRIKRNSGNTNSHQATNATAAAAQSADTTVSVTKPVVDAPAKPALAVPVDNSFPFATDVLSAMTPANGHMWLQMTQMVSPPFVMRAKVRLTTLTDFQFHYGFGMVIFDWWDHPENLRVRDPRNSVNTSVSNQGLLLPNEAYDLAWKLTPDAMTLSVNGRVCYEGKGDYAGLKARAAFYPITQTSVKVESFVLETPRPLGNAPPPPRDHGPIAGDLLPSMVAGKNLHASPESDGLGLQSDGDTENRLLSTQTLRPPFLIRTRAKTDSLDLRLYYGAGIIIFNWRDNPTELRVHEPNGKFTAVGEKGLILPNEWHAFIWEVHSTGMRLFVDGQLRFQNRADYRAVNGSVGIGPAFDKITVDYFLVEHN